jgi:hypothetical protein
VVGPDGSEPAGDPGLPNASYRNAYHYDRGMNPVTGVIGEAWQLYRRFLRHLLLVAFVIYLPAAVLDGLVSAAHGAFVAAVGSIIALLAGYLVQAALVTSVQDIRDGRVDLSVGKTITAALPSLGPVTAASIIAGILITIGLVLLIVPGLIMITFWALIVPAIVIEGSGPLAAFGRSRQLVRGHAWPVFGVLALTYVILYAVNLILGLLLGALPLAVGNGLATVVSGTLVAPFIALVVTSLYYRLTGQPANVTPSTFA